MHWIRLSLGIDAIPCDDSLLLRSDFVALRIEGASAAMVGERLIPFVREWRSVEDLCAQLTDYEPAAVRGLVDQLVGAGVLATRHAPPAVGTADESSPWPALMDTLGVPADAAMARMRALRVAVFGLEQIGGHVVLQLARLGLGSIALVDPGMVRPGDVSSMPLAPPPRPGLTRQRAIAELIEASGTHTVLREFAGDTLTRDAVRDVICEADCAVGTFDRAFGAAHHWINAACLETGTPALYCDVQGVRAQVGPMVFPGETPCYMCWRMRRLATFDNFAEAMAYESAMDKARAPQADRRPVFPPLVGWAASVATAELAKILLGIGVPQTTGRVLELDALESAMREHRFLHRPDCPSCRGRLQAVRRGDAGEAKDRQEVHGRR
jgi:ribosomal protein S12 methylthiotransferase accessory factor